MKRSRNVGLVIGIPYDMCDPGDQSRFHDHQAQSQLVDINYTVLITGEGIGDCFDRRQRCKLRANNQVRKNFGKNNIIIKVVIY